MFVISNKMSAEKYQPYLDYSLISGNVIMSAISLVSSFVMFCFILFNKQLKSLSYVLLSCIGLSEVFQSLGFFISIIENNEYRCLCAQIFIILSDSWTMLFLSLLSWCTYSLVIKNNREIYKKSRRFIMIGFIGGGIYATILLSIHFLSSIKAELGKRKWCTHYIKLMGIVKYEIVPSMIIFYVVNWVMVVYICVLYLKINKYMKERSKEDPANSCKIMAICNSLAYYPVFGFLGWAFTTAFLFIQPNSPETNKSASPQEHLKLMLMYLAGIFVCLRGFLISVFFFSSDKIWSYIKLKWRQASKPLSNVNFLQFTSKSNEGMNRTLM